jgi:hypothetical protein
MTPCRAKLRPVLSSVLGLALVAIGSAWTEARAQAWMGDKGGLEVGLDYNLGISNKVVGDGSFQFTDAGTMTHQLTLSGEYVPVQHLAVSVGLPFVALKYIGNKTAYPHAGGGSYDDGDLHATLTDLRAGVRYQVLEEPVAITPHVAFSIPVADYETVGNTVAGRHLKALHLGLGVGHVFGAATYVHLLYEFSLVEKYDRTAVTEQYGQNHSDLSFTVGHKLLDQKLDLHADFNMRLTHGGVNFSELNFTTPDDRTLYHDAILKEDIFLVGGGVGYQLTNALGVSLGARFFVAGQNTQNASVIALGLAWTPL